MHEVKLGQLIAGDARRDAVHVAVMPMIATTALWPGQRLQNGTVDPFLIAPVQPGERYWLMLFPGTVTTLRHCWTAPGFAEERTYPDEEGPIDPANEAGTAPGGPSVIRAIERDEEPVPGSAGGYALWDPKTGFHVYTPRSVPRLYDLTLNRAEARVFGSAADATSFAENVCLPSYYAVQWVAPDRAAP